MSQDKLNKPLLGVNFFAGNVAVGLGPYLAIYLLSAYHWKPGGIGMALAAGSIAAVLIQTPAGAIIDATRRKRSLLAVCTVIVGIAAVIIVVTDDPSWLIYCAQVATGIASAFAAPAIAAMTLGLVGPDRFRVQSSANQAWNHAGNVCGAALGAALAIWWLPGGVFWLALAMAVGMLVSIALIDRNAIDHDLARGGLEEEEPGKGHAEGILSLLSDRRLLIFAACVVIFHFANAAMLPLVSQELALGSSAGMGIAFTSGCIVISQFFMIPMALLCGARADIWGRKPLFLAAFAFLPVRGLLFTLSSDSYYLIGVQSLDGLANGIFGMIFLLVLADLTRGTGRFNAVQGALTTLVGLGATFSNIAAGWVVELAGYSAGFLFLASIGAAGALLFGLAMPETAPALQKKGEIGTSPKITITGRI